MATNIEALLGNEAESLLTHTCKGVTADELNLPGPDYIDRVFVEHRPAHPRGPQPGHAVPTRSTGWDRLPVDPPRGPGHRALRVRPASPRTPPTSTPPTWWSWLSRQGRSGIATTLGGLGAVARRYAHRIPFIVKLNHNEFLHYPSQYDQVMFGTARQAADLGAVGVGATIYFGSEQSDRQIQEVRAAFAEAHELGMFTVLWCYLRNPAFKTKEADYHVAADLTGQANHIGVTIEADLIKQKQPENNGGYNALKFGKTDPLVYETAHHGQPHRPHPLAGHQLLRGPHRAHQLRGRVQGRRRPGPSRAHRRHQQAGGRHGAHRGPQGVPATHGRRRRAPPRRPGRLPRRLGHHRLDIHRPGNRFSARNRAVGGHSSRGGSVTAVCSVLKGRCSRAPHQVDGRGDGRGGRSLDRGLQVSTATRHQTTELDRVVIRFAGDSGDGMQLTGTQFTSVSSMFGNDTATLPDFPAEIRAPAGTLAGVSAFQVHISDHDILTPGDQPSVLVAMNPAALKTNVGAVAPGGTLIVNVDAFDERAFEKANYTSNPLTDGSLVAYKVYEVPMTSLTLEVAKAAGREAPRRRAVQELLRPGPRELALQPARGRHPGLDREALRQRRPWCSTPTPGPSRRATTSARRPSSSRSTTRSARPRSSPASTPTSRATPPWRGGSSPPPIRPHLPLVPRAPTRSPRRPTSSTSCPSTSTSGCARSRPRTRSPVSAPPSAPPSGGRWASPPRAGPGRTSSRSPWAWPSASSSRCWSSTSSAAGPPRACPPRPSSPTSSTPCTAATARRPVPIVAPMTPSHCFDVAIEAARIAVKYRTPVIVLSDGYLANGAEPWRLPDPATLPDLQVEFATETNHTDEDGTPAFWPYVRDEETLARPWAVPGTPGLEHRIGALEKQDGSGNVSYDPVNHERMVHLRAAKVAGIAKDIPLLEVDDPAGIGAAPVLVLGWGSTFGAIAAGVRRVRARGLSVAHAHLVHLNPFPSNLGDVLRAYDKVLVPEANLGQLAKLVRADFLVDARTLTKVQGVPFRAAEIEEVVLEMLGSATTTTVDEEDVAS